MMRDEGPIKQDARSLGRTTRTFKDGVAWPLRVDHPSVYHPRKPNCIIALRIEHVQTLSKSPFGEKGSNEVDIAKTHDVDKFLNLADSLGTDLTHLKRHERSKLIALQNKQKTTQREHKTFLKW
jgi:hypothetical protein